MCFFVGVEGVGLSFMAATCLKKVETGAAKGWKKYANKKKLEQLSILIGNRSVVWRKLLKKLTIN